MPYRIDAAGKRRLGNDPPIPDGPEQIIFADHPITVPDQIDEQIEDLRPNINQLCAAPQLAAIHVYRISTELEWHSGLAPGVAPGPPGRRKIKAISGVNEVRVKALWAGPGIVGDDPPNGCHNDRRHAFGTPIGYLTG